MTQLESLYETTGISLQDEMKEAIGRYIANNGLPGSASTGFHPGTHAEIFSANELLKSGVNPEEIFVGTLKKKGQDFEACVNCKGILAELGVPTDNVVTGVVDG